MHAIILFRERCKDKPTPIVAEMFTIIVDNIENIVTVLNGYLGFFENNAKWRHAALPARFVSLEHDAVDRLRGRYSTRFAAPVAFSCRLIVVPHLKQWGNLIYAVLTDRSISALGRHPAFGEMRLRRTFPANRSG